MSPQQTCPHCKAVNRVANLHDAGRIDGKVSNLLYCGFCGKRFPAAEGGGANPFKADPGKVQS